MLRLTAAALLLANLLFLAWTQGVLAPAWPPPGQGQREPARLAAQVHPERVRLLPPKAANDAVTAARRAAMVCLEAGPFAADTVLSAEEVLSRAQLPDGAWTREGSMAPPVWLLFAGRYPDATLRSAREAELKRLKLSYEMLRAPAELAPGFVLSRHASREAADAALAALNAGRVPGVRVQALPAEATLYWLRVAHASPDQAERLAALAFEAAPGAPPAAFKPCAAAAR